MKKLLLISVLITTQFPVIAQANLDSLWGLWENQSNSDSVRQIALKRAFLVVRRQNLDSAMSLATRTISISETNMDFISKKTALKFRCYLFKKDGKHSFALADYQELFELYSGKNDTVNMATTLNNISYMYHDMGDFENAFEHAYQALDLRNAIGDGLEIGASLNDLGNLHKDRGQYKEAIQYYAAALKYAESAGDQEAISIYLNNIGVLHKTQRDFSTALNYYERSLEIARKIGDSRSEGITLNSIGNIYFVWGQDAIDEGDTILSNAHYKTAIEYFGESLLVKAKAKNNSIGVAMSLGNIGHVNRYRGELDTAIHYYQESLNYSEKINYKRGMATALNGIAVCFDKTQKYDESIRLHKRAFAIYEEIEDALGMRRVAKSLYISYKSNGDFSNSLEKYELYQDLNDSLLNESNQRELIRHEYKYTYEKEALTDSLAFAKKEAVLQEQTEKQKLGLFAAGGGFLLLLSLALAIFIGKKKSDELLLNILPYETAQELKKKGHSDAKLIDEVSVIFTDFKGFTALSEQLSPKELVRDLNLCFSEFDRIMDKHGIEKIKTIGDAYMAAGGLPTPSATHATDAIKAAFEMRDFVEEGKAKKISAGLPYFEVRIGIHTGPVVAGIVGIKKFQYDIWGDTVNTASRMESSGEVGKINISETTYEIVKDEFTCVARGYIEAKGKGKVKMFFVDI